MATMTENQFLNEYDKIETLQNQLISQLQIVGKLASEILKCDVTAELCNGNEIEFREVMPNGRPDFNSCIRLEDILAELNK